MELYQILLLATLASIGSSLECYFCQNADLGLGYDPECGLDNYDGKTFSSNKKSACFTRIFSDNRAARGTAVGGEGCSFGDDYVLCLCADDLCNNNRCNQCFNDTTTAITEETTPSQIITDVTDPTGPTTPEPTGSTTPEPTGSTTPEPTGPTTPEPTGSTTPEPTGPTTPEPTGSTTPEPTGSTTPEPTGPTTTDVTLPTQGISCYSCSNSYGSDYPHYEAACGTHPYLGELEHSDEWDTCFTHVYDDGRVSRNGEKRDETEPCHYGGISGDGYTFCYCKEDGCNNDLCYEC